MDMTLLYKKFHETKQDKEKLRVAVELCLRSKEEEAPAPDVERYLRLRQRSAVELLIGQGDLPGMRRLTSHSWFERKYLPDYLRMAQEAGRTEFVAELLREWYGRQEIGSRVNPGGGYTVAGESRSVRGKMAATDDSAVKDAMAGGGEKGDTGRMAREIIHLTIQGLMQSFPFLGGALLALEPVQAEILPLELVQTEKVLSEQKRTERASPEKDSANRNPTGRAQTNGRIAVFGTDGEKLYYESYTVCHLFRQDPRILEYLTLHSLFHCLFCHIFLPCGDGRREEADRAADQRVDGQIVRMMGAESVRGCHGVMETGPVHDCHDFWPSRRESCTGNDPERMELLRHRWKYLTAGEGAGGIGLVHGRNSGGLYQDYRRGKRKTYDYRRFLEQFMVRREERMLDMENFDPIWYHYSRDRYEGLVFLEPLETREVTRLEEILIAIDTSASCSGEVVERFLDETFAILERQEHFFHRMNVHIVQCDCMIQDHVRITCERQWRSYRDHLEIRGLGDTDFTPVFALAGELERTGQVKDLKGILYFTDGDGIFPRKAPPWPSAFVFLNHELEKHELPDWAIRLNLSE